jgi:hypothetical protein
MELAQFLRNRHYKKRYMNRGGLYLIVLDSCTAACPGHPGVKVGQTRSFIHRFVSYVRTYKGCRLLALCVVPRHGGGDRIRALEAAVIQTLRAKHAIRPIFMHEWYHRSDFATVKHVLLAMHKAAYPYLHRWVRNISTSGFDQTYHHPSPITSEDHSCRSFVWTARLRGSGQ